MLWQKFRHEGIVLHKNVKVACPFDPHKWQISERIPIVLTLNISLLAPHYPTHGANHNPMFTPMGATRRVGPWTPCVRGPIAITKGTGFSDRENVAQTGGKCRFLVIPWMPMSQPSAVIRYRSVGGLRDTVVE